MTPFFPTRRSSDLGLNDTVCGFPRRSMLRFKMRCGAIDVDPMALEHLAQIGMQCLVTNPRGQRFQFANHPGLSAVEKGEPFKRIRDCQDRKSTRLNSSH